MISKPPFSLTDEQLHAVMDAAHALPPDRRSDFLKDCAAALAALPEGGDGLLHRTITQIQQGYVRDAVVRGRPAREPRVRGWLR